METREGGRAEEAACQATPWHETEGANVWLLREVGERVISLDFDTGHSEKLGDSEGWIQ